MRSERQVIGRSRGTLFLERWTIMSFKDTLAEEENYYLCLYIRLYNELFICIL